MTGSSDALAGSANVSCSVDSAALAVVLCAHARLARARRAQSISTTGERARCAAGAGRIDWHRVVREVARKIGSHIVVVVVGRLVLAGVRSSAEGSVGTAVWEARTCAPAHGSVGLANARAATRIVQRNGFAWSIGLSSPAARYRCVRCGGPVRQGAAVRLTTIRGAAAGTLTENAPALARARDGTIPRQSYRLANSIILAVGRTARDARDVSPKVLAYGKIAGQISC